MLISGTAKHGMHGMSKLMEEVLYHPGGEEGWGSTSGRGEVQHQYYYWSLRHSTRYRYK